MTNNEGELRDWRKGTPKSAEVDSYGEGQHFSVCGGGKGGGVGGGTRLSPLGKTLIICGEDCFQMFFSSHTVSRKLRKHCSIDWPLFYALL